MNINNQHPEKPTKTPKIEANSQSDINISPATENKEKPAKTSEIKKPTHQALSKKKITLTEKQARFVANRLEGKDRATALRESGLHQNTSVARLEDNPNVRAILLSSMKDEGIDERYLARKLLGGLDSKKTIYASYQGKITDKVEIPDNETQHKYFRDVLEIRGDIKNDVTNNLQIGLISIPEVKQESEWNSEPVEVENKYGSSEWKGE